MKHNDDISKELKEVAPALATLDKVDLYQVDAGYFQNSADNIMAMIGKEEMPSVLSQIKKTELYSAPASRYFESFADNVMSQIHREDVAEELSYSAPHLLSLPKREGSEIPATYFASFPEIMTQMAAHEDAAHHSDIEQLTGRWAAVWEQVAGFFSRPVYALAIASCVGLVVCIGLVINNNSLSEDDKIFAQMQQISDSELHSYIGKHRDDFDERSILHNINETDFNHYFDKPEDVPQHFLDQSKGAADQDINLDEITD